RVFVQTYRTKILEWQQILKRYQDLATSLEISRDTKAHYNKRIWRGAYEATWTTIVLHNPIGDIDGMMLVRHERARDNIRAVRDLIEDDRRSNSENCLPEFGDNAADGIKKVYNHFLTYRVSVMTERDGLSEIECYYLRSKSESKQNTVTSTITKQIHSISQYSIFISLKRF
ncbi:hypothetical protein L9F63_005485, partial [Diploptera punctata]